jgi:hypothetical protein
MTPSEAAQHVIESRKQEILDKLNDYKDRLKIPEDKNFAIKRIDDLNKEAAQLQSLNSKDVENAILKQKKQWEDIVSQTKKYSEQSKAAEAERRKDVVTGLQVGEKPMSPQNLENLMLRK